MRLPQEKWFKGKVVKEVLWQKFEDGRGGETCNPVIKFEDGSFLSFSVAETDIGCYGVDPVYTPNRRR